MPIRTNNVNNINNMKGLSYLYTVRAVPWHKTGQTKKKERKKKRKKKMVMALLRGQFSEDMVDLAKHNSCR